MIWKRRNAWKEIENKIKQTTWTRDCAIEAPSKEDNTRRTKSFTISYIDSASTVALCTELNFMASGGMSQVQENGSGQSERWELWHHKSRDLVSMTSLCSRWQEWKANGRRKRTVCMDATSPHSIQTLGLLHLLLLHCLHYESLLQ